MGHPLWIRLCLGQPHPLANCHVRKGQGSCFKRNYLFINHEWNAMNMTGTHVCFTHWIQYVAICFPYFLTKCCEFSILIFKYNSSCSLSLSYNEWNAMDEPHPRVFTHTEYITIWFADSLTKCCEFSILIFKYNFLCSLSLSGNKMQWMNRIHVFRSALSTYRVST